MKDCKDRKKTALGQVNGYLPHSGKMIGLSLVATPRLYATR